MFGNGRLPIIERGDAPGVTESNVKGEAYESPPKTSQEILSEVGQLKGKTKAEIQQMLTEQGFTKVESYGGEGEVWTKPGSDGNTTAVRIDPPKVKTPPQGHADEVPHVHKEVVPSDKVIDGNYRPRDAQTYNDNGNPTSRNDWQSNHIVIKP